MLRAAGYGDTFVHENDREFTDYYTCLRKWDADGKDLCCAAIQSLQWGRMTDTPLPPRIAGTAQCAKPGTGRSAAAWWSSSCRCSVQALYAKACVPAI